MALDIIHEKLLNLASFFLKNQGTSVISCYIRIFGVFCLLILVNICLIDVIEYSRNR